MLETLSEDGIHIYVLKNLPVNNYIGSIFRVQKDLLSYLLKACKTNTSAQRITIPYSQGLKWVHKEGYDHPAKKVHELYTLLIEHFQGQRKNELDHCEREFSRFMMKEKESVTELITRYSDLISQYKL